MPNKRRTAKLATKMLISGKMKSNKDVQETMKFIKQKQQEDKEDINFDVIESFGKSLPTKIPKLKKRKAAKQTDETKNLVRKDQRSKEIHRKRSQKVETLKLVLIGVTSKIFASHAFDYCK